MKVLNKTGLLAGLLLMVPVGASAALIDGELGIAGVLNPYCVGVGTCDMSTADALDFGANGYDPGALDGAFLVTFAVGDFSSSLGFGSIGSISDFQFAPLTPAPVSPLWTAGGFSFSLEAVTIVMQTANFFELSGIGTISHANFDDTSGAWTLSADSASGGVDFSWSSTTMAVVPIPGGLVLLASGLAAMGLRRRS